MSRASVARALQERAERLAREAWTGAKTGAEGAYRAGAGLVGAPQGPSRSYAPTGIGSDRTAARDYSGSGYGDPSIGSRIAADLRRDFGLTANQAAGIVGNLGHESGGFKYYQEISPRAGRGGAGWAQWTDTRGSPRRTAFENYTRANNLNPNSYEANYGFLKNELTGTHKGALAAVKKANTVQDAVYAFEGQFERAGVKNYGSRMRYANSLGGSTISTYSGSGADPNVAAMQQHLNSLGAKLTVDGLRGPLTRAAEKQFLGSPTSVRTPSFTAPNAAYRPGSPGLTLGAGLSSPYTAAPATPRTPYYNNPYSGSTGGSINPNVRSVPTVAVQSNVRSKSPLPSYYDSQLGNDMTTAGGRRVPTTAGYAPPTGPVLTGGFSPPARAPTPQTPAYMNPYTMGTGGANAIVQPVQTARMPQPRPSYPPPSLPTPTGPTMFQQMQDAARRAAAVAAQVAQQAKDAYSQSTRSGMGYSGGGGYTGGSYGGAGGRSINTGVGGAFRNR